MIIFNATMKDSGNYTCVAKNSVATVTTILSLTVNGMIAFCWLAIACGSHIVVKITPNA